MFISRLCSTSEKTKRPIAALHISYTIIFLVALKLCFLARVSRAGASLPYELVSFGDVDQLSVRKL